MRILHVVPSYYPAVRYGGTIPAVHDLAKALVLRGHEVQVYTTNVDGPGISNVPLGSPVDKDGVLVWYFPTGAGRRLFRSPQMTLALRSNLPAFDIAHLHSAYLWPASAAAFVARRIGIPYILTPHGMLIGDLIRRKNRLAKRCWIAMFERRNVNHAAAVHVTTQMEADELQKLGLKPQRLAVIPYVVDLAPAAGCTAGENTKPFYGNQKPFILFLGRVNWKKGLDRLISAMAQVPGVELVVAGNDEENYQPELEALAHRKGVAARTCFIGPVYGPGKWALLRQAQLLILPSYSENFAIVVLEAMAVGCPVIVTPEVGLATIVRETNAGLVVEGTPERLAAAINGLLQDRDKCRRMGEAGRRTATKQFSSDAIAKQMERVYEECVREGEGLLYNEKQNT
jgi:glycosyltransferase involved in cell wall biosynthesis